MGIFVIDYLVVLFFSGHIIFIGKKARGDGRVVTTASIVFTSQAHAYALGCPIAAVEPRLTLQEKLIGMASLDLL